MSRATTHTRSMAMAAAHPTVHSPTDNKDQPPPSARGLWDSLSAGQLSAFALLYISYVGSISSTSSIEVSLPALALDPSVSLDAAQLARALAAGQMATVAGKLGSGFVIDWRGDRAFPEAMISTGLMLMATVAALHTGWLSVALACFVCVKLCKAAVGPAKATSAKRVFPPRVFARLWGILVTASRVGATCGSLMLAPLAPLGWYWPPLTVGFFMTVMGIGSFIGMRAIMPTTEPPPTCASSDGPSKVGLIELLRGCMRDHRLLLIVGSEAVLLAVVDISSLIPLFISSSPQFDISLTAGAALSSLYPAGMAISTISAGFVYDAAPPTARFGGFLLAGLAGAGAFLLVGAARTPYSLAVALFLAGAAIAPAKYILPTIYVMDNAPAGEFAFAFY